MQIRSQKLLLGSAALASFLLSACIPPAPEPTPAPTPSPTQSTAETQPLEPDNVFLPNFPVNWIDQPQTGGDWSYAKLERGSVARFTPLDPAFRFMIVCNPAQRQISFLYAASNLPSTGQIMIRAGIAARAFNAERLSDGSALSAPIPASDNFLEAIAYSRGRFAVGAPGSDALYLPAYPEIIRVTEDCRG